MPACLVWSVTNKPAHPPTHTPPTTPPLPRDKWIAFVSTTVETSNPQAELAPGLQLLGRIDETFIEVGGGLGLGGVVGSSMVEVGWGGSVVPGLQLLIRHVLRWAEVWGRVGKEGRVEVGRAEVGWGQRQDGLFMALFAAHAPSSAARAVPS